MHEQLPLEKQNLTYKDKTSKSLKKIVRQPTLSYSAKQRRKGYIIPVFVIDKGHLVK